MSAITLYDADLDTKPIATSAADLLAILEEKRYLNKDLDLTLRGVSYSSTDGNDATINITIEATNKTYEIAL